jgi:HAD superfamily hydrolase (TIGR01490 family)
VTRLALFDFDGTITVADTFTPFILRAVEPRRLALGKVALSPVVAAYKLRLLPATRMRRAIVAFGFRGRASAEVRAQGLEYSRSHLPSVVRPRALERVQWHQTQEDEVAVVSASLDVYLSDWCQQLGVALICTELEERDGTLTGRYRGGDCTGAEKARRVRQRYDLQRFSSIFAYGDTPEDSAMLALADQRYYRSPELA